MNTYNGEVKIDIFKIFIFLFRGVLQQRQNRLTEAIQAYKKAIHFRPKLICKSIFQVFVIVLPQQYSYIRTSYIYLLLNIFHSSFIATVFVDVVISLKGKKF